MALLPVRSEADSGKGTLGTFFGVYVPVVLSILSVILFLRFGWVLGQTGLVEGMFMILVACLMTFFTILSISAIATNGRIKGGGCYYMISRALGPEFGGSIGVIFYCANVFAAVLYLSGFAESVSSTFKLMIYNDYLTQLIIASILCFLLTLICLVGASLYAKTTFITFIFVMISVAFTFLSFFVARDGRPKAYTGFSLDTFVRNLGPGYTYDADSGKTMNFRLVFAIFFPACTGIMAGVNMSGDLKNPAKSIPWGTLLAFGTTVSVYVLLMILMAFTTRRDGATGLRDNKPIIQSVAVTVLGYWIIAAATWVVTLAAALASLIGASRVLQALARDNIIPFIGILGKGSGKGDEPRIGVVFTWLIAQACLFIGNVNLVAPIDSMFFLMSYAIVNLACFIHVISGAPNFRPIWPWFNKWTAGIGCVGSTALMFIAQPLWASVSFIAMAVLFIFIHYTGSSTDWGDISQALIYHQVRKFLLRLDVRKDHIKYWRPQLLLIHTGRVSASTVPLLRFGNNLKKGGLYVIGIPVIGTVEAVSHIVDKHRSALNRLVTSMHLKGFGEVLIASDYRQGVSNLIASSGLGFMKPNTVAMELYNPVRGTSDTTKIPADVAHYTSRGSILLDVTEPVEDMLAHHPPMQDIVQWAQILRDVQSAGKNIALFRNFETHDEKAILAHTAPLVPLPRTNPAWPQHKMTVDAWVFPYAVNPFRDIMAEEGMLVPSQELCLLMAMMVKKSKFYDTQTTLRVCSVVDTHEEAEELHKELSAVLLELRIKATVVIRVREDTELLPSTVRLFTDDSADYSDILGPRDETLLSLNSIMRQCSGETALSFITIPVLPEAGAEKPWLEVVEALTRNLPPTVMVNSKNSIIATHL
ncbi:Amino acid permease [Carpediemonas membranifera]|uniref:Amino acid permease n=1 Tax=Carpediemonas membranifera TaxID=201153 RepID=A0A8J6APU4_9EUKA|nr:Amino acid permease [Carpediemonas membranifera]|eukprot:KAG9389998.1 Amino acid permease [Carpediemonas membranifera]